MCVRVFVLMFVCESVCVSFDASFEFLVWWCKSADVILRVCICPCVYDYLSVCAVV